MASWNNKAKCKARNNSPTYIVSNLLAHASPRARMGRAEIAVAGRSVVHFISSYPLLILLPGCISAAAPGVKNQEGWRWLFTIVNESTCSALQEDRQYSGVGGRLICGKLYLRWAMIRDVEPVTFWKHINAHLSYYRWQNVLIKYPLCGRLTISCAHTWAVYCWIRLQFLSYICGLFRLRYT
jgi:hypothetical protein